MGGWDGVVRMGWLGWEWLGWDNWDGIIGMGVVGMWVDGMEVIEMGGEGGGEEDKSPPWLKLQHGPCWRSKYISSR